MVQEFQNCDGDLRMENLGKAAGIKNRNSGVTYQGSVINFMSSSTRNVEIGLRTFGAKGRHA
ncbi:hypothetical protein N7528_009980 [Penicillium herquei]|nr:hypothetical protein N7528_009980 [Penicillium herquei]